MKTRKQESGLTRKVLLAAIAIVILPSVIQPCYATREMEVGKMVLSDAVEAIGGVNKALGWKTRIDKGKLTAIWPGWGTLNAVCTRYVKKPDKMKFDQDFSAYDHPFFFTYYYNAGEVWMMVNLGTRQHPRYTQRISKQMKTIDDVAYYFTNCDTFFVVIEVPQDSLLSRTGISRVGVVDDGDTVLFDLDGKTHLPVRRIEENGSTHVLFDDYRTTGGLKIPYHVTVYQNGSLTAEYKWEEIKFGEKIDDAIFEEFRPKPKETEE